MKMTPYFEKLSSETRHCPECGRETFFTSCSAHNPNGMYERCKCGWFDTVIAPESEEVIWDEKHPWDGWTPSGRTDPLIISFDSLRKE